MDLLHDGCHPNVRYRPIADGRARLIFLATQVIRK